MSQPRPQPPPVPDAARSWPSNRHEAQWLASSLRSVRLSLLFGDPGAGKTTLLRDGVLPLLRRRSADMATAVKPREGGAVVLPFPDRRNRTWAELVVHVAGWGDAPLSDVHEALDTALNDAGIEPTAGAEHMLLADRVADLAARHGSRFLFVFDRFERVLPTTDQALEGNLLPCQSIGQPTRRLTEQLIGLLNGPLPVNALLAMRIDAEPAFDPIVQRIESAADVLTLAPRGLPRPSPATLAAMPVLHAVVDLADELPLPAAAGLAGSDPHGDPADAAPHARSGSSKTRRLPEPELPLHGPMRLEDVYASIAHRLARTNVNVDPVGPIAGSDSSFDGVGAEALPSALRKAPTAAARRPAPLAAPPSTQPDDLSYSLPDCAVIDEMFARNPPAASASTRSAPQQSPRPVRSRSVSEPPPPPPPPPPPRFVAAVGPEPASASDRLAAVATIAAALGGKSSGAGSRLFIHQRRSLQRLVIVGVAALLVVGATAMWRVQQQRASSRLPTMATIHEEANRHDVVAAPGSRSAPELQATAPPAPAPAPAFAFAPVNVPSPVPSPVPLIAGTHDITGAMAPGVTAATSLAATASAPVASAATTTVAQAAATALPPATPLPALPTIDLRVDSATMEPLVAELARAVAGEGGVALHLEPMRGGLGAFASGAVPRLAIVRYDNLQAAARTRGDARRPSVGVIAPLFTEDVFVVVRADSNLRFLHQLKGRRIASGPAQGARALTAAAVYRRMFGLAMQPASDASADASAEVRQLASGNSPGPASGRSEAVVVTAPHPAAWLAALPADIRAAIRLLRLDPSDPAGRRALQVYLPANLVGIAAAGVGDEAEVPSLSAMSFLVLEGRPDAAQALVLNRFVTRLCRELPVLQRTGDPKWRNLRPGLELPTAWPVAAATAQTWRRCEALTKGTDKALATGIATVVGTPGITPDTTVVTTAVTTAETTLIDGAAATTIDPDHAVTTAAAIVADHATVRATLRTKP